MKLDSDVKDVICAVGATLFIITAFGAIAIPILHLCVMLWRWCSTWSGV